MQLSKQQRKVFDYIQAHPGCTTKDIRDDTFVQCPTGRMSEMRVLGIVFKEVGERQYPGAKPFKMYALEEQKPTFEGFQKYLKARGWLSIEINSAQRSELYQSYLSTIDLQLTNGKKGNY